MKANRYITVYSDLKLDSFFSEYVHYASSLPAAIKDGRSYVRALNRSYSLTPGIKRYCYFGTRRAR